MGRRVSPISLHRRLRNQLTQSSGWLEHSPASTRRAHHCCRELHKRDHAAFQLPLASLSPSPGRRQPCSGPESEEPKDEAQSRLSEPGFGRLEARV